MPDATTGAAVAAPYPPNQFFADNDQLKTEALQRVLNMIPLGLATGASVRGGVGLMNFLRRQYRPPEEPSEDAFPYPLKAAAASPFAHWLAKLTGIVAPNNRTFRGAAGNMLGDKAQTMADIPWYTPGVVGGLGGGLYGGYMLTDHVLDRMRRNETSSELDDAKRQYEEAIAAQFKSAALTRLASDYAASQTAAAPPPAPPVATQPVKQAIVDTAVAAMPGWYKGLLLTLAGASGVGAFKTTYDWTNKRSPQRVLDEAVRRRQLQRIKQFPQPVFIGPPSV